MRTLHIAWREGKSFFADRMSLVFSILLPLVLMAVLVGTFSGQAVFTATACVVDLDGGPLARDFCARLDAVDGVTVRLLGAAEAESRLEKSRIYQALVIPAGFSERVAAGEPARITLRRRGNGDTPDQVVAAVATGIAWDMSTEARLRERLGQALTAVTGRSPDPAVVEAGVRRYADYASRQQVVRVEEDVLGRSDDPAVLFFPGMMTMFGLFSTTLVAASLVQERRDGTLERLVACGAGRGDLVGGKFLGYVLRGMMQVVLLTLVAAAALHIFTPRSFLDVLAFSLVMMVAFSAVGLLIATATKTPDQAIWTSVVVANVMAAGGGSFFDATGMKGFMGVAARLTPNFYANSALRDMIGRGQGLWAQWPEMAVLGGVAAVLLLASAAMFRFQQGVR